MDSWSSWIPGPHGFLVLMDFWSLAPVRCRLPSVMGSRPLWALIRYGLSSVMGSRPLWAPIYCGLSSVVGSYLLKDSLWQWPRKSQVL